MQQITHALVPGTFDPITFGHIDVARRASRLFPHVTVAVAESLGKNGVGTVFTLDERVELARTALSDIPNVDVQPFCGLLVDFARQVGAGAVVKGLRAWRCLSTSSSRQTSTTAWILSSSPYS